MRRNENGSEYREYRKDGWIYINNKPIKKWFRNCYSPDGNSGGVRIWEPILSDVSALEARRWRMKERKDRFYNEIWKPAYDAVIEAGEAYAKPVHEFTGELKWWRYYRTDYENWPAGLSWDWAEDPGKPKNFEIGQLYYNLDRQIERYYKYVDLFNIVLESAIYKYLQGEHSPERAGITFRLVLNGRNYWYTSEYVGHAIEWVNTSWPESPMIEIVM